MPETTGPPTHHHQTVRTGHAWTVYRILLRWTLLQIGGTVLPLVIVVQALLAAGVIVGFGLLIPDIDTPPHGSWPPAPHRAAADRGLVLVPSGVAQARADGTFTYQRACPSLGRSCWPRN
jgi:ABC-2 type transport system permease protein